jgi:hypothetical protein
MANTTYGTYVFRQDQTYADTLKRLLAPGSGSWLPGRRVALPTNIILLQSPVKCTPA